MFFLTKENLGGYAVNVMAFPLNLNSKHNSQAATSTTILRKDFTFLITK